MRIFTILLLLSGIWANAITIVPVSVVQPTCTSSNGAITVNVFGGVPPYTYAWSDGPITQNRTNLAPGSYTLTVTDSNADNTQSTFTLTAEPDLGFVTVSYIVNGVTQFACPGLNNGIAVIPIYANPNPNGWYGLSGTPPFGANVLVDGSPASPGGSDIYGNPWYPGLTAGSTLDITVTDAAGCQAHGFDYVAGPSPVAATVAEVVDACAGGPNGSIRFTPSPDFLGFLGQLHVYNDLAQLVTSTTPFQDPLVVSGLAPGTYTINVTYGPQPYVCSDQYLDPVTVGDLGIDCGAVQGTLFIDNDQDCTQGSAEVSVPYLVLEIQPGSLYAITDENGSFQRNLANGNYTLQVLGDDLFPLCPAIMPTPFTIANISATVDLADSSTVPLDLNSELWGGFARPGFAHTIHLGVRNHSAQVSGALTTTLIFDPQMSFSSATPTPTSVTGNVIVWNTAALSAYAGFSAHVVLQVPADVALIGQPFAHSMTATQPLTESDLSNNDDAFSGVFTGAYDPNDKTAYTSSGSSDELYFLNEDTYIDYRVRFQNTGSDTAFTVVVTDTISELLDLASFEQGLASHPFSVTFKTDRVVEWTFANILLPDSGVNEAASHGLITFRIKPVEALLPGTELINNADIYFDFNPPIRTNDAVLVTEFSTGLAETSNASLRVFPNPAQNMLTLFSPEGNTNGELRITAPDGRIVLQQRATRTVDVEHLAPGLYVISLRTAEGVLHQTRVVKQ